MIHLLIGILQICFVCVTVVTAGIIANIGSHQLRNKHYIDGLALAFISLLLCASPVVICIFFVF